MGKKKLILMFVLIDVCETNTKYIVNTKLMEKFFFFLFIRLADETLHYGHETSYNNKIKASAPTSSKLKN